MKQLVATGDTLCSLNVFPRLCTVQPLKSTEIKAGAHSDKIVSRIAQAHIHGIYGQRWKQASRTIFSPLRMHTAMVYVCLDGIDHTVLIVQTIRMTTKAC